MPPVDTVAQSGHNLVDVAVIVMLALGFWRGYRRKLSGEIAGTVGLVVMFLAGAQLFHPVDAFIVERSRISAQAAHAVAFIVTLLLSCGLMFVVRVILARVMEFTFTESFDRWGGAISGTIRFGVFAILFIVFMLVVPHAYLNETFGSRSAVGRVVIQHLPSAREAFDGLRVPSPSRPEPGPTAEAE